MNHVKNQINCALGKWGDFKHYSVNAQHWCRQVNYKNSYTTLLLINTLFQVVSFPSFFAEDKKFAATTSLAGNCAITLVQLGAYFLTEKNAENGFSSYLFQDSIIKLAWCAILISSIALSVLGHPLAGLLAVLVPLACANFSYYRSNAFTLPPLAQVETNPIPCTQTIEIKPGGGSYNDFLNCVRVRENVKARIDLSAFPLDNDLLFLGLSYLFSHQKSSLYPHEVDLSFCSKMDRKGVECLLDSFPNLTLFLKGTALTEEEVYELQSKYLEATLHFTPDDLSPLFEKEVHCDITFRIEDQDIKAHSFVLTSLGCPALSREPYKIEGISQEDFVEVLKSIYRGSPLKKRVTINRISVSPSTVGMSLYKKTLYSDLTVKVGSLTLPAHKGLLIGRSDYLLSALQGGWKENEILDLTKSLEEPLVLETFLQYCYTETLPELSEDQLILCLKKLPILGITNLLRLLDEALRKMIERRGAKLSDLCDAHNANLLITKAACTASIKKTHGVLFSFAEEGHLETLTVTNTFSLPADWQEYVKKPLTVILDLDERIHGRNGEVFDLLRSVPIKSIQLTGTWYDFLAFLKLNMEDNLEKLHILGSGEIDLSLILNCSNLLSLTYRSGGLKPAKQLFKLNKLQQTRPITCILEPGFTELEQSLPHLRSVTVDRPTTFTRDGWEIAAVDFENHETKGVDFSKDGKKRKFSSRRGGDFNLIQELSEKSWHSITVECNRLNDTLLKFISGNASVLSHLELIFNAINDQDLTKLQGILAMCKNLTSLSLCFPFIFDINRLAVLFKTPMLLRKLELVGIRSTLRLEILQTILQLCPNLRIITRIPILDIVKKQITLDYPRLNLRI